MSFAENIANEFDKYGQEVKIINGDDVFITRAFVEPLRYKNKIYIGGSYRALKGLDKYLYTGKPGFGLKEKETVIETDCARYLVIRTETYCVNDSKIYDWAILKSLKDK